MVRVLWGLTVIVLMTAEAAFGSGGKYATWEQDIRSAAELLSQGRLREAHALLHGMLVDLDRADPDGARAIVTLNNLGNTAQALGRYDEAEGYYGRAIRSCEKNAECRKESLPRQLGNLASLYLATRRYGNAERIQRQTLAALESMGGLDRAERARQEEIAAAIAWARKRPAEAAHWNRRALESWTSLLGPSDPRITSVLNNLGVVSLKEGDIVAAEDYFLRSVSIWGATCGPTHAGLVEPLLNLGRLHLLRRAPDRAGPLLSRALALAESTYGAGHRLVGSLLVERSELLRQLGRVAEAREDTRRGHALLDRRERELGRSLTVDVRQLVVDR